MIFLFTPAIILVMFDIISGLFKGFAEAVNKYAEERKEGQIEYTNFRRIEQYSKTLEKEKNDVSSVANDDELKALANKLSSNAIQNGELDKMAAIEDLSLKTWGKLTDELNPFQNKDEPGLSR